MSLPCQPKSEPVNPSPEAATAKGTLNELKLYFVAEKDLHLYCTYFSGVYYYNVSPLFWMNQHVNPT